MPPAAGGQAFVGKAVALPLQVVSVWWSTGGDADTCSSTMPPCSFPNNRACNAMTLLEWQDGGAGGRFGKLVGGVFETCPASQVTHYECPDTLGTVSITVRLDDIPQAIDPATQQQIATADDDPITSGAALIAVWDITNPAADPVAKFVMSGGVPSEVLVSCAASRAASWSTLLGGELAAQWQGAADPTTSKTLRVHTDSHNHGFLDLRNWTLPCSNSEFGGKGMSAAEWSGISTAFRSFLLFYPETDTNNPTAAASGQPVPNWYHYWKQTSANYGDHSYDPNCPGGIGFCTWGGVITIGPGACGTSEYYPGCEGIDLYAVTCRHEGRHKWDYEDWWPGGDYHDSWDMDLDGVNDLYEEGLGYTVGDPDTDNDTLIDMEDHAVDSPAASWTIGYADDEDWAAPGKNW